MFNESVNLVTTISGFLPFLYDASKQIMSIFHWESSETAVSITCIILQSLIQLLISVPWDYYDTFVIEEKSMY